MHLYKINMTLNILNDVVDYVESTRKSMISLTIESTCKLINRIPGLRLLISSLLGSVSRTNVILLGRASRFNKCSQIFP